ncbi:hypothetical protein BGX34_007587 [Mortierella sp. NVP85]|nr:hypothetical protein BGX34_007582 [Mortierella sp. NVP85]KAF9365920.1 hypothetical protein BGX34_007587 [Mortierella sp. NVP85]
METACIARSLGPHHMISKIAALALLVALASRVDAYYFHAEIAYQGPLAAIQYKVHPVDIQVPGNDALVMEGEMRINSTSMTLPYEQYGYKNVRMYVKDAESGAELAFLSVFAFPPNTPTPQFDCAKTDEFRQEGPNTIVIHKAYICSNPVYYGRKGIPATTTTPTPAVSTTCLAAPTTTAPPQPTLPEPPLPVPTTTYTAPPVITCTPGYKGKKNGKGPNGACCSSTKDCKNKCVKGVCRAH